MKDFFKFLASGGSLIVLIAMVPSPVSADEPNGIAARVTEMTNSSKAVLIIGPRAEAMVFNRRMSEADLPTIGCTYLLEGATIQELVRAISRNEITEAAPVSKPINARIGITFYGPSGKNTKFVFEEPFIGAGTRGVLDEIPIIAKKNLGTDLRALVLPLTPKSSNFALERRRPLHSLLGAN